ncbi:DUF2637 domain-containing protein [Actinacidiphila acididurans]|uniref:DUF2637 domain-containing protein n=1 Tax=Actinacidiphila acididurans TaxID=2784346 RepID=A0ABS2TXG0_9ACTN|nr:DUF2637 domain-containing protein [Actinacidiphila acididurans]MBM9508033.1 DUF2637 domain-containing protein [Actinacidiphila acididurans]
MTLANASTAHVTGWDRAVVIALGGAGCALSYDALQQMAVAIHVRGPLTYLFPLVIDGFIAYGIRALLVLRDAPLRARLYVWMLFGTATAVSVWANALHAVRLNQQEPVSDGLRLSDTVVAVLSTVAPLALAGAVHLYILIARGPVADRHWPTGKDGDRLIGRAGHQGDHLHLGQPEHVPVAGPERPGQRRPNPDPVSASQPVTGLRPLSDGVASGAATNLVSARPGGRDSAADVVGQPDSGSPVSDQPADSGPVTVRPDSPERVTAPSVTAAPVSDRAARTTSDRRTDLDTEELLEIARSAVRAEDKLTRKVVAQAIRGQKIPLSSDTLTALMVQLREQHGQPVTTSQE